ncbi:tandem-95 repeat protein [Paenibacillus sp. PSB04]|nr:tandem-95 repeat protein [Paenibacillus sp. PSB04]
MKKRATMLAVSTMLLLSPQMALPHSVSADAGPVSLTPSADALWDQTGYYPDLAELFVGNSDQEFGDERAAIAFDLSSYAGMNVGSAKLMIYINQVIDTDADTLSVPSINLYGLKDSTKPDSWGTDYPGLNKDNDKVQIFTKVLDPQKDTGPLEIDVTPFVQEQMRENHPSLTFLLEGNGKSRMEFTFLTMEASLNKPQLTLELSSNSKPPVVSNPSLTVDEDTMLTGGLVLTPDPSEPAETPVTHFKIGGITGGKLYLQDGTTEIPNNSFITREQGEAGLRFLPDPNANSSNGTFSFNAYSSQDINGTGLSPATSVNITVNQVNDAPTASDDTLSPFEEGSGPITIPVGALTGNDSVGPDNESDQKLSLSLIPDSEVGGTAVLSDSNVIFTPTPGFRGEASFRYKVTDHGKTGSIEDPKESGEATVSFNIEARADKPSVIGSSTQEDTMTSTGLVITPGNDGGATANFYKITSITGGTLYKANGTTLISNDDGFITTAEGAAGLKFKPDADASGTTGFGFTVQAAPFSDGNKLSDPVTVSIPVSEVNDPPVAVNDVLEQDIAEEDKVVKIPISELLSNDSKGASNESGQTLSIVPDSLTAAHGTAVLDGDSIVFTPAPNYFGPAEISYTVTDNGTTDGSPDPKTAPAKVSFTIQPVADEPSVTDAETTEDNQTSNGLVISGNSLDGAEVNYFKITGIQGGTLYKNDGTVPISNGDFITASEGQAGLKFTPGENANSPYGDKFSFMVQAAVDKSDAGLSEAVSANITVSEENDDPVAVDDVRPDINEDAGEVRIPIDELLANDSKGASNEDDQELSLEPIVNTAVGGTVTLEGKVVVFKPTKDYSGSAGFTYKITDNGTKAGAPDYKSAEANVSFNVKSVADQPIVTDASTTEDKQTDNGLEIRPNAADGTDVRFFKISSINGGTLYRNDGVTSIEDGSFIPVSAGEAGLKFTPAKDANSAAADTFSIRVQAALDDQGTGLSEAAQANITVTEVNDQPNLKDDDLGSIEENSGEKVISFESLLVNDTKGADNEFGQTLKITDVGHPTGGTVRFNDDKSAIIFTPAINYRGAASFEYTVTDDGKTDGALDPQSATATVNLTVNARADKPTVTPASTAEDTQTKNGLVITPTSAGGAVTNYFKISGITGGTLYQQNGQTPILDGDFITVSEGGAGLKFTPNPDAHGTTGFGFLIQAALDTNGSLLSDAVTATVAVTEVNDAPVAQDDNMPKVKKGTGKVIIPFPDLTGNDSAGPLDESQHQTLSVVDVADPVGGDVSIVDDHVKFIPDPAFSGKASFTYVVVDNGQTDGSDDFQTASAQASFDILDEDQPVITLNGDSTIYLPKGQTYDEPGYSAYDEVDKDLTDGVVVTGSVDSDTLGTYILHYNVADSSGNPAPEETRTVQVVSSNLSSLTVGGYSISPAFDPDKREYTLNVPSSEKTVTVAAIAADPSATLVMNGFPQGSSGSQTVNLKVGSNEVTIVVTAQGGSTRTYTLQINRQASGNGNDNGNGSGNNGNGNSNGNGNGSSNGSGNGGGNGNGHGNGTRQAKVITDQDNANGIVQVDITRATNASGKVVDSVALKGTKVDEVVANAAGDKSKVARIVIDDIPGQPADEVAVSVSAEAVGKLNKAGLSLVIEAEGARITLPAGTVNQLNSDGKDLYFRVVPVRQSGAAQEIKDRVIDAKELQQYVRNSGTRAVGQPMTIETNYADRQTKVMFPLTGIDISADPQQQAAFLNGLAIFVEHSDGQKEVKTGELVYENGKPIGLEIRVEKFSTFTFISTDADYQTYVHYISGYPDGTFRPAAPITRAEMAALIARQMQLSDSALADAYPDLAGTHWAAKAVLELTAAGIMSGDDQGSFKPEQGVTRAEMATIAARLKGLEPSAVGSGFKDVARGHWASQAINAMQQAGLMAGFDDGTFRPAQQLTRAEAVSVVNRLFGRPLLKGQKLSVWPDVPASNWAAADIESASNDIQVLKDGSVRIEDADAKDVQ